MDYFLSYLAHAIPFGVLGFTTAYFTLKHRERKTAARNLVLQRMTEFATQAQTLTKAPDHTKTPQAPVQHAQNAEASSPEVITTHSKPLQAASPAGVIDPETFRVPELYVYSHTD